jgi:IS5 family transposase
LLLCQLAGISVSTGWMAGIRGKAPGKTRQAAERRPAFRRTVKWRTGSEGRISTLKRGYGWDRTRLDGTEGARTWAGHGVLAHNLVKISTLAA